MSKNLTLTLLAGCLVLGFSTINAADSSTAKVDDKPAWPQSNGPFGNFNPRQYGCKLVDDLKQVKSVWTSEENDLGYCKTGSSGFIGNRANWPGHPGAANGLIAAEGMIFAASFRPAGEVWADGTRGGVDLSKFTPEQQERLKRALSIDADDFIVAIDQATGKTVWKVVEEKKGLFRGMGKRGGWGVSPAYHAGKVFYMGTTGRLYCLEANTGKKVWESNIGKTHQLWEELKMKCLEKKELPPNAAAVSLVIADGVLIVPLYDTGGDMSLGGVDVLTGKMLWQVANATAGTATPALWRHEGREYVLAATHGNPGKKDAKMRLISPKDGKVLWTVEGLSNTHFSLAPSEKHVMVNVGSATIFGGMPWLLLGCYELSLSGAKLVWTMPDEIDFFHEPTAEASDWRKYLIRDGKVYYNSFTPKDKNNPWVFSIFDEATGKLLFKKNPDKDDIPLRTMSYLLEDRMMTSPDPSHSNTTNSRISFRFWTTDPKDIRPISAVWSAPHPSTGGYNVFMEFPYVDGRIYMRAKDGTVRCYDLRAEAK